MESVMPQFDGHESVTGSGDRYKALYHMLLDAIPSSVLVFGPQLQIVSANRNFLEKSRRRLENTLGRRLEDVFPEIILEQIDIEAQIRQVFQENHPLPGQRLSYRAPGIPLRIYYYRVLPYTIGQTVENVILLMEDVTEQTRLSQEVHRAENHLASVISSASDMVVSTDAKGRIVSWNPAAEKITGMPLAKVRHQRFWSLCKPQHRLRVEKIWSDVLAGHSPPISEWEIAASTAAPIRLSWVCSPLRDEGGRANGVVALGRDLTEQRRLELQLIQSQKLAALGVMAGGIAHQVRNPLAICSSAAQFLKDDTADPQLQKVCAAKIHKSIRKASSIIENLLKFARPASGFEKDLVDICGMVRDAQELVSHQAQVKKIHVKVQIPGSPVFVDGNSDLLQQAVVNLMLNAIEAMTDGGELTLGVSAGDQKVTMTVEDTGRGMTPEDIEKMFDPFFTQTRDNKGTGLGLSISYAIIELHAGTISVQSESGRGSIFTVTLCRV